MSGLVRLGGLGWVRRGLARFGVAWRSGSGWVRHGLVRRGPARQGGHVPVRRGRVWLGAVWHGKAVKLINKWWAVVAHYTNIRNFLEDSNV